MTVPTRNKRKGADSRVSILKFSGVLIQIVALSASGRGRLPHSTTDGLAKNV